MSGYSEAEFALAVCCGPSNKIITDDQGEASVMVFIPKMTYKDLGMGESTEVHPAFIVNGKEIDGFSVGKYQACVHNNRAYSLPGRDPKASINIGEAETYCTNKGPGWSLMNRYQWGLLVRICQLIGHFPDGNINYGSGKDGKKHGIPSYYDKDKTYRIATGSGGLTYSHDGTQSGIMDLCGNVWEFMGGIRILEGEIQIIPDYAIGKHKMSADSPEWRCISAADGSYIIPDGKGTTPDSVKIDWKDNALTFSKAKTYQGGDYQGSYPNSIKCDPDVCEAAKLKLQALGMLQYKSGQEYSSGHYNYLHFTGERVLMSGGFSNGGSGYGVGSFNGVYSRSSALWGIGFRVCFIDPAQTV